MAAIRMANYHGGLAYLSSRDDTGSNGSSPLGPVLDRKICTILFRQFSGSCTNKFRVQQGEHLMCCLTFIMAKYNFVALGAHDLADANNSHYFLSHYPQTQASPTGVPPELVELLLTSRPDWVSPHWTKLWSSIFNQP